jgi:hypothetical protein
VNISKRVLRSCFGQVSSAVTVRVNGGWLQDDMPGPSSCEAISFAEGRGRRVTTRRSRKPADKKMDGTTELVKPAMISSESSERVPSWPCPLARTRLFAVKRLSLAEAVGDAGLHGKWPANMGNQTERVTAKRSVGNEWATTKLMNGRNRPPRHEGMSPKLSTLASAFPARKTEGKPLKPNGPGNPGICRPDQFPTRRRGFLL